jgi:hypothetical protein
MFCPFLLLRVFESLWKPVSIEQKPMCEGGQKIAGRFVAGVNAVTKLKDSAMQTRGKGLRDKNKKGDRSRL